MAGSVYDGAPLPVPYRLVPLPGLVRPLGCPTLLPYRSVPLPYRSVVAGPVLGVVAGFA